MTEERWVRNRLTGQVHNVPAGHWSLQDPDYEEVDAPAPARTRKRSGRADGRRKKVTNDGT